MQSLTTIGEVETFIHRLRYLLEVPSTEEVKKSGIGLSNNQAKKIEDLTSYLIHQNKPSRELDQKLSAADN